MTNRIVCILPTIPSLERYGPHASRVGGGLVYALFCCPIGVEMLGTESMKSPVHFRIVDWASAS